MSRYIRKEKYPIEKVLSEVIQLPVKIKKDHAYVDFDGDFINMTSQRYQVFSKNTKCVTCGLKASFFAKEKAINDKENNNRYHFNLYGLNPLGEEVLFTKDHIIRKREGGKDALSNYQTMCYPCNKEKN